MENYVPPFHITPVMLGLVASISEKLGKLEVYKSFETKPRLRRNNRIKSVHSSLKIESNSLTEGEVRAVLGNRTVIGPQKEIQEVKNAFAAYDEIGKVDPYSLSELKRVHGIMTYLTVEESGVFRKGAEGVFEGDKCIFMAPPPGMVPSLMDGLFAWLRESSPGLHPLIQSCIFHYEFVFIHPFTDGNGRMARLWQTVILSRWNPLFSYLPIESQIEKFQEGYYNAIAQSHVDGTSDVFTQFMLAQIDAALETVLHHTGDYSALSPYVEKLLAVMEYDVPYTAQRLAELLGIKTKAALKRSYLDPALKMGIVEMTLPDKPTSKNQKYVKK